ncbi:hypothetical protein J6590_030895 [Homalodisca vitripennis]|nr:hypothetical protein J6590_030895 [Homalodisca vitripennis]
MQQHGQDHNAYCDYRAFYGGFVLCALKCFRYVATNTPELPQIRRRNQLFNNLGFTNVYRAHSYNRDEGERVQNAAQVSKEPSLSGQDQVNVLTHPLRSRLDLEVSAEVKPFPTRIHLENESTFSHSERRTCN